MYGVIKDETIFGRKLVLRREIEISKRENSFVIRDEMENTGDRVEPLEVLYHMNMGYPLLDEESIVKIPAKEVLPRNDHAAEDIDNCLQMEKPQAGYEERCYYHKFNGKEGCARETQEGFPALFQSFDFRTFKKVLKSSTKVSFLLSKLKRGLSSLLF